MIKEQSEYVTQGVTMTVFKNFTLIFLKKNCARRHEQLPVNVKCYRSCLAGGL